MSRQHENYYERTYAHHLRTEHERNAIRARYSRRTFLRGSTILAMGGVGAFLLGCNTSEEQDQKPASTGAAGTTSPAGATQEGTSAYPLVTKYNWRKLDWTSGPPLRGGRASRPVRPLANWDLMKVVVSTPFPPFYNGLYRPRGEAGPSILKADSLDLDGQQFVRDLAQSEEHNGDFTQWTFKLPPNVKFHNIPPVNGRAMTAADVVYSFDVYRTKSLWADPLKVIDKVTAVDPTTVRFDLKQPSFTLPNILAMPYYVIFAKEHFEGDEKQWTQQPIGTGAFQMTFSNPGVEFKADRHPEYWEKDANGVQLPYLDGWEGKYYQDRNALLAAFRAGNIDETGLSNLTEFEDIIKDVKDAYYTVQPHWATYQNTIVVQWDNPLFKDVRIRRALSMAIDRKGIVDKLLGGAGTPSYPMPFDQMGLKQPLTWDDMPPPMRYDPKEAKKLLDAAGSGTGLKLSLLTSAPVQEAFVAVQQYWKDVGVQLNLEEVDSLVYQSRVAKKDYKDVTYYNGLAGFDADVIVRPLYYPGSAQNMGKVDHPGMTALLDKLYVAVEADERTRLAKQVNDLALTDVPTLPLNGYHTFTATHNWLHTFSHSLYTTPDNWSSVIWRYFWLDDKTPGSRGGKKA